MKKGFTLIELLSVVVILGIISLIITPIAFGYIEKSRKESFEIGVNNTIETSKTYVLENYSENDFPISGISVMTIKGLKHNDYISGIIKKDENGVIVVENVSNGKYCANGSKNNLEITKGDCSNLDNVKPEAKLKLREAGTDYLLLSLVMIDSGSGISKYSYCYQSCDIDNNWIDKVYKKPYSREEVIDVIKIDKLKQNKEYIIKVKVVDGNGNEADIETKSGDIKTEIIEAPKFKVTTSSYSSKKEVTIIYPKYQDNYTYKYNYNGNEVILDNGKSQVSFEALEDGTVEASIVYNGNVITSRLNIVNIDIKAPENVEINIKEQGWSKQKTIEVINAVDTGSGLAFKPYQFNKDAWTNINKKIYKTNGKITLKTKDRLGNYTEEFTYNGNKYTELEVMDIDSEAPRCNIELAGGSYKDINGVRWYYTNPKIRINIVDQYKDANGNIIDGGSGVGSIELIKTTGTIINKKTINMTSNAYEEFISDNGMHLISITTKDKLGNVKQNACSISLNIDGAQPKISAKSASNIVAYNSNANLINYFTINTNYGPTGGNTKCYVVSSSGLAEKTNNNQLQLGINKIKCVMTGNNGKVSEAITTIRHKITSNNFSCDSGWTKEGNYCIQRYCGSYNFCGSCTIKSCN